MPLPPALFPNAVTVPGIGVIGVPDSPAVFELTPAPPPPLPKQLPEAAPPPSLFPPPPAKTVIPKKVELVPLFPGEVLGPPPAAPFPPPPTLIG